MFKVQYRELRSMSFLSAMNKLTQCEDFGDVKTAYNIMRVSKALEKHLKKSQNEWIDLANKFIKRSPDNKFMLKDDTFDWLDGVDKDVAEKSVEDFLAKEVIVEWKKLDLKEVAPAKLSPAELGALEPVLSHLESVG